MTYTISNVIKQKYLSIKSSSKEYFGNYLKDRGRWGAFFFCKIVCQCYNKEYFLVKLRLILDIEIFLTDARQSCSNFDGDSHKKAARSEKNTSVSESAFLVLRTPKKKKAIFATPKNKSWQPKVSRSHKAFLLLILIPRGLPSKTDPIFSEPWKVKSE